jgi:hypothetical protein
MGEPGKGLDEEAIERETAVPLPERDAMSLIDPLGKLVPIGDAVPGDGPPTIAPEDEVNNLPPVE